MYRLIGRIDEFDRWELATEQHVAAAEEHPVFQQRDWKQSQVLAAIEELEKLPPKGQSGVRGDRARR